MLLRLQTPVLGNIILELFIRIQETYYQGCLAREAFSSKYSELKPDGASILSVLVEGRDGASVYTNFMQLSGPAYGAVSPIGGKLI